MKHHKEKFEFVERETERVMQNALMTSAQGISITISNTTGFKTVILSLGHTSSCYPLKPSREFQTCLEWTAPLPAA